MFVSLGYFISFQCLQLLKRKSEKHVIHSQYYDLNITFIKKLNKYKIKINYESFSFFFP